MSKKSEYLLTQMKDLNFDDCFVYGSVKEQMEDLRGEEYNQGHWVNGIIPCLCLLLTIFLICYAIIKTINWICTFFI